jgi:hypothetical protein
MAQRAHRRVALPIGASTDIPISHSSDLAEDPRVTKFYTEIYYSNSETDGK